MHRALEHALDEHGVRSHIDDFGTGASSLRLLHGFPGDAVKIHRALVIGMGVEPGAFEIVKALVGLAHNLGLEVIAEGVETAAQLDHLQAPGLRVRPGLPRQRAAAPRGRNGAAARSRRAALELAARRGRSPARRCEPSRRCARSGRRRAAASSSRPCSYSGSCIGRRRAASARRASAPGRRASADVPANWSRSSRRPARGRPCRCSCICARCSCSSASARSRSASASAMLRLLLGHLGLRGCASAASVRCSLGGTLATLLELTLARLHRGLARMRGMTNASERDQNNAPRRWR